MKQGLYLFFAASLILNSCEKDKIEYYDPILKIGDGTEYTWQDFELYDSSTKIIYFKTAHPEFVLNKESTFSFYTDTTKIYQGCFWPGKYSYFPQTPFITSGPYFYLFQNFALYFEFLSQSKPDPRNDPRLIAAFKNKGILHSGLSISFKDIAIEGTNIVVTINVTNKDKSDLLIMDHELMGINLFHYYTYGLVIWDIDKPKYIYCLNEVQDPPSLTSWKKEWLSVIKSGASKQLTISYKPESPLSPGNYIAYYTFPGFNWQISLDDLFQDEGRIWLGKVITKKTITIK
jgi:hypothetical protein